MTLKISPFRPFNIKAVKMYTCGPSTYQRPHVGNYRTFLFEDVLQRYLEYLGCNVSRLMTLTDIEDKALAQAVKEGVAVEEMTIRNEARFFRDFDFLRIKRPNFTVRASTIVDQAVVLIGDLLERKIAYKQNHDGKGNIYFDPLMFAGFGRLSHLDMGQWPKKKRRFHKDTYPGMPWNRGDFVIWHGCKSSEKPCWDTPLGMGRPAWNIQDAAAVSKYLGFQVDVACGGVDNLVRHHDYTLAVLESISGKTFSDFWVHGGHLYLNGKKMAKSTGNVLYLEDLASKGYTYDQIRFFLIYGAYRGKRNFTWEKIAKTSQKLDALKGMICSLQEAKTTGSNAEAKSFISEINSGFEENMNNNLDVKKAFDEMFKEISKLSSLAEKEKIGSDDVKKTVFALHRIDSVLQVIF
jgi:cysteinyl-tRNA synthetase